MPHAYNRQSFMAASNCGKPLLEVYAKLVVVELALKDHSVEWCRGHDIPGMLTTLASAVDGINSLSMQLTTALNRQPCTDKGGTASTVSASRYPDLRYLRHEDDFGAGMAKDSDLLQLVQVIDDVIEQLRKGGISI